MSAEAEKIDEQATEYALKRQRVQCPACGEETLWLESHTDWLAGFSAGREHERKRAEPILESLRLAARMECQECCIHLEVDRPIHGPICESFKDALSAYEKDGGV